MDVPPPPLTLRIDTENTGNDEEVIEPPASPAKLEDVDPAVLAQLPSDIREEVLASFQPLPNPPSVTQEVDGNTTDSWECPMCTFLNHAALSSCEICEFNILGEEENKLETEFKPDSDAFRLAAEKAKSRFFSAIKATNEKNDVLLKSASAALQKVQISAANQLHQLQAKLSPRGSRQVISPRAHKTPSHDVCMELAALQSDLKIPCVAGEDTYETLLHHLWASLTDVTGASAFEREGEGWMTIGFQRVNPDTDFRGGGLLALKCLVYVCHMHTEKMLFLFKDQVPESGKRWYPVCVAGINLTCLIAGLLKLGDGSFASSSAPYWPLFQEPNAFFEVYFIAMVKMDQIWHRSRATYMEFGEVLNATKKLLRYVLAQGPCNLMEFIAIVEKIQVDEFKITRRQEYFEDVEDLECPDPHHQLEEDDVVSPGTDFAALKYTKK